MKWTVLLSSLLVSQIACAEPSHAIRAIQDYDQLLARAQNDADPAAQLQLARIAYECSSTIDSQLQSLCAEIPFNSAEDGYSWLVEAAENGSIDAQVAYGRAVVPGIDMTRPENRKEYFRLADKFRKEAVKSGSPEAIYQTSLALFDGANRSSDQTEPYAWTLAAITCGFSDAAAYKSKAMFEEDYDVDFERGDKRALQLVRKYCTGK